MIMFISVPLQHKLHNGPYDYDHDHYVASGNQAMSSMLRRYNDKTLTQELHSFKAGLLV